MIEALEARFGNRVQKIDADRWKNIYVMGDVHGCTAEFDRLVEKIDLQRDELLICVGDVIEKGPDNRGMVERVRDNPNIRTVLGNSEIGYLRRDIHVPGLRKQDRAFVHRWPLVSAWRGSIVVHGGINPRKPIAEHSLHSILTIRSIEHGTDYRAPYWFDEYRGDIRIFFGHTVVREPVVRNNVVGLDTGCVYGGGLTAYDCGQDEYVSVESEKAYRSRPDEAYYSA